MKDKILKAFDKAKSAAEKVASDEAAASKLIDEALKKADNHRGALSKVKEDLQTLLRMLSASITGKYKNLPWKTIIYGIAGVLYFVNPMDIIPDFIVGTGFLDDITVLGFVFSFMKNDLIDFRSWEKKNKDKQ